MKVVFFLIDMNIGGTEKSLLNLLDFLPKSYEITILLLKKQGGFLSQISKNISVVEIENQKLVNDFINKPIQNSILGFLKQGNLPLCAIAIKNYLKAKITGHFFENYKTIDALVPMHKVEFDIAVAFAGPHEFISYYIINKVKATKKIQWIHFDISKIHFNKKSGAKLYPLFDIIYCVSKNATNKMFNNYPNLKFKLITLENKINYNKIISELNETVEFKEDLKKITIVTVGRVSEEKGHKMIIETVLLLLKNNLNFIWYCIGGGTLLEECILKTNDLKIGESLKFIGSKTNPYPYINQCDIYVQPSIHEGFGLTVEEAKFLNKPIVITNFDGASDIIINNYNGIIVPISSDGIYNGIVKLIENEQLRNQFIANLKLESELKMNKVIEL